MFRCSVKKKLEMLGKHGGKILVGGSGEETDGEGDKPDATRSATHRIWSPS